MKNTTQISTILALTTLLSFSACGGGGDSSSAPEVSTATDVTVERGKVYDAVVVDSSVPAQIAEQRSNYNIYRFAHQPVYPISASGGWIDVNVNGIQDAGDVPLDITLTSYSNIITPLTTYIADENQTIREIRVQALRDRLNADGVGEDDDVSVDDLLGLPSLSRNLDFTILINAIYKDMEENGGNLDNSNIDTFLAQFHTIEGMTSSVDPIAIEVSVVNELVTLGYLDYVTIEVPEEDPINPIDENLTLSSSEVHVATSNETIKEIYQLWGSPLLKDSKAYMRLYRAININGFDVGMKVLSYDLSQFNTDMNISDLPTNVLYEQVGPNYTHARFNQRYYDIAEVDNNLFFATMPENIDTLSQSSFIKYDITSDTELYHVKRSPINGEYLNTTFDLARGWFIPFNSNNYMGIVEDAVVKVINSNDGSSYKYDVYDYLGLGASEGAYTDYLPPVATENEFFAVVSGSIYKVGFLSNSTNYGSRDVVHDSAYQHSDILSDFNATYNGTKPYKYIRQVAPLVLDGENIYALTSIRYRGEDTYDYFDLYLLTYDRDLNLKSATYLDGSSRVYAIFDAFEAYKYKDVLYFKFRHDAKHELCAYDLTSKSFLFRHEIGNYSLMEDYPSITYVITGNTIIMPEYIQRADLDPDPNGESGFYYDLVFKVMDINDGSILKILHHKDLNALRYSKNDVRVKTSLSDANAVYFFADRMTLDAKNNMIIKIDTPSNSVQKSRDRFNNHLTGVITDSN